MKKKWMLGVQTADDSYSRIFWGLGAKTMATPN